MPPDVNLLTDRQREVYEYLLAYVERHGDQPTMRTMCRDLSIASVNGIVGHLNALEKKGFVRKRTDAFGQVGLVLVGWRFVRVPDDGGPYGAAPDP